MRTLIAFLWGAVASLLLVLIAGKVNAYGPDKIVVSGDTGHAMSIEAPVEPVDAEDKAK